MHKIDRPKSLTELVYQQLRGEIVAGELELGELLSESKIAKRVDVSRTPVREAFARLELEGLVETLPQRGTFVFTPDQDVLRDICDTRVCLECGAMQLAFSKKRKKLVGGLSIIVRRMLAAREKQDDKTYLHLDTDFHQHLVDATGNPFMNDAYQTIASKMAALRNRLGSHPDHMEKSFREHILIVERLEANDIDGATEVLVSHIGRKEGSYWNA